MMDFYVPFFDLPICKCGKRSHPCYAPKCEDCWVDAQIGTASSNLDRSERVHKGPEHARGFGLSVRRNRGQ